MNKVAQASEQVAVVFEDWLKAEVTTSGEDRNKYLDNFDDMRERLTLGWGHDGNWSYKKEESHMQRLPQWFEDYKGNPAGNSQAEFSSARLLFSPLMFLSGSHRVASYIRAKNQTEYLEARARKPIDIDIEAAIKTRFDTFLPSTGNFATAKISMELLDKRMKKALKIGESAMKNAHARLVLNHEMGVPLWKAMVEMENHQYNWVTFAADCVILAAKLRKGELEAVPFLEPLSISDQSGSIYYPLYSPINWAEVLAH